MPNSLGEQLLGRPIRLERFRLSPRSVSSQHEVRPEPLAKWMLDGQSLEVGQRLRMLPDGETGAEEVLLGRQVQLLQAGDLSGERRSLRQIAEWGSRHSSSPSANVAAASRGSRGS